MALLDSITGRIGVWGYGVVGKAVACFFLNQQKLVAVFDTDSNKLSDNIKSTNVLLFSRNELPEFFKACDYIVPSPGIDLRPYAYYNNRYIAELDLFADYWRKPIIGITGSVGKTSITTILGYLLNHNDIATAVGGNIGIGSLELLTQSAAVEYALLELSSFQLEHTQRFAPQIAIITNLHANHLDRHGDLESYWRAKAQIAMRQTRSDLLIIDWELRDRIRQLPIQSTIWYIGKEPFNRKDLLLPHEAYWYTEATIIAFVRKNDYQTFVKPEPLFSATLPTNALTIFAALAKVTNNNPSEISFNCDNLSLPHRRELVGCFDGITFINDSKATSLAALAAAVNHYQEKSTYLLIGGLSKGVDRTPAIATLPSSVIELICFGAEAEMLCAIAIAHKKNASVHKNLDDALKHLSVSALQPESVVLLSPAGSSYDLYKNYEERGNHFKQLVYALFAQK